MVQRYSKKNQNNNNYLQYIDKLGERLQRIKSLEDKHRY